MKACPEKALLLSGFPEEEDGAFEGMKVEEEEGEGVQAENVSGSRPFVVVKLEEEQAACSARCSSAASSASEAKMELELDLFAPVESEGDEEDEQQQRRRPQRALTDTESRLSAWPPRGARERGSDSGYRS